MPALQNIKILLYCVFLVISLSANAISGSSKNDTLIFPDKPIGSELTLSELEQTVHKINSSTTIRAKDIDEEKLNWLISQSEKLNYSKGIAVVKDLLGVIMRDHSEFAKAIELHESALSHAENDTIILLNALNNLGVVYRRLDKPRKALDYHMHALKLAESYNEIPAIALRSLCIALNSIGNINLTLNQPEKALEVFNQSLLLEQQQNNDLGIAINYENIGLAYQQLGKPDVALSYFQKSLQHNKKINSAVGQSICYNSIGDIFLLKNKPYEALSNYKTALSLSCKTNDDYHISQAHANLGRTYLKIGNLEEAFPEIVIYNEIAKKTGSGTLLAESYKLLSDYYEKQGDYEKAFSNFKTSVQFNDSIINDRNTRYLTEMQVIYEAEKKQQQIEILTKENKIKSQRALSYLLIALLVFLIWIVIYFYQRKRADEEKIDLEMKLFRSMMNPHFIFNALGSIQSFLYKNESQKAASYLGSFSKLTRSTLKNSTKELIPLEEEISTLRNYMEIEQMRQRESFSYKILADEELEQDFIFVPPMMLQPFVENAIHHGVKEMKDKTGTIEIKIEQFDKFVRFIISDNGIGINAPKTGTHSPEHKSMGIDIFRKRIKLIKRKYKKSINFEIIDLSEFNPEKTGTQVTIDFPIIEPND
jgi:tetratricopeptide (TPR) repeat protein